MPVTPLQLAITSAGMASSLGLDAVTACAAARAGLSRADALSFEVLNAETNVLEPVLGHAIATLTSGFEGIGRLLRVMQLGLADFRRSTEAPLLDEAETAWMLAVPEPLPGFSTNEQSGERVGAPSSPDNTLRRFAEAELGRSDVAVVRKGRAGFAIALQMAVRNVTERTCARCVVGAADTLLDSAVLRSLREQDRLKAPDQSVGLSPGEAAAFVLVEPLAEARRRGASILGVLSAVGIGTEEDHLLTGKSERGRGLAAVAVGLAGVGERTPWLITDHNGEAYRASEWSYTLTRLVNRHPAMQSAILTYPAMSFGDTGSASGALGLCVALHGFARRHAPAQQALIFSSSDRGGRGVVALTADIA